MSNAGFGAPRTPAWKQKCIGAVILIPQSTRHSRVGEPETASRAVAEMERKRDRRWATVILC